MKRLVVVEIPGLTRQMVENHAPRLRGMATAGRFADLIPEIPAVTMPGHASLYTGLRSADHGLVANGWFDRAENRVKFWQQSEALVGGQRVWDLAKQRNPDFTSFKYFWWPGMASTADLYGNVRPAYCADGRKLPDVYFNQDGLAAEVQNRFGTFPLFRFWGPASDITSTRWIADTAQYLIDKYSPTLSLIYLPHLDYRQQSHGPRNDQIPLHIAELDEVVGNLIDHVRQREAEVMVVSGYHINAVEQPIFLNRLFRDQGWLRVITNATGELIDYAASQVFAVADHQVAHIYVRNPEMIDDVAAALRKTNGVAQVLDEEAKRAAGLNHQRSGELVALADPRSWFAYYYWLDDTRAPDFARTVAIHDKPGYDPCELILDPRIRFPKLKIAGKLLRKMLGMRYLMDVIPLDASLVKGSHGLLPQTPNEYPVFLTSWNDRREQTQVPITSVKDEMLACVFDKE